MRQAEDLEMENEESKLLENDPAFTEPKHRISKLIGVIILNGCIAVNACGFSVASPQIAQIYSLNSYQIWDYNLAFPIVLIIGGIVCASFLSFLSIRYGVLLTAILVILGSVLRCAINHSFEYAMAGQTLIAVGYGFSRSLFTHVSSRYFFPKNRAFITGLNFSFNSFFIVLSAYIPVFVVPPSANVSQAIPHYRYCLSLMFSILAPVMSIGALVALYLLWNEDQTKSSPTSEMPRLRLRATCTQLFTSTSFILLALLTCLTSGIFWSFLLVAHSFELEHDTNKFIVLILSAASIPLIFMLNSVLTMEAGRKSSFKKIIIPLTLIALIILIIFSILSHFNSLFILGASFFLLALLSNINEVLQFELAAEIGFPAAQTFTSGLLTSGSAVCILILINFEAHLYKHGLNQHFYWMLTLCSLLSCILACFVKEKKLRRQTDLQFLNYGRGELDIE